MVKQGTVVADLAIIDDEIDNSFHVSQFNVVDGTPRQSAGACANTCTGRCPVVEPGDHRGKVDRGNKTGALETCLHIKRIRANVGKGEVLASDNALNDRSVAATAPVNLLT
jgi:hypothetical protein